MEERIEGGNGLPNRLPCPSVEVSTFFFWPPSVMAEYPPKGKYPGVVSRGNRSAWSTTEYVPRQESPIFMFTLEGYREGLDGDLPRPFFPCFSFLGVYFESSSSHRRVLRRNWRSRRGVFEVEPHEALCLLVPIGLSSACHRFFFHLPRDWFGLAGWIHVYFNTAKVWIRPITYPTDMNALIKSDLDQTGFFFSLCLPRLTHGRSDQIRSHQWEEEQKLELFSPTQPDQHCLPTNQPHPDFVPGGIAA